MTEELNVQSAEISQACQVLNGLVDKVNKLCEQLHVDHKKEIAKLSVEIARKVLVQKVEEGDYQIEAIIEEALDSVVSRENLVVRLNPGDLAQCQKLQQEHGGALAEIKFVADANIGLAECLI